MVLPALVIAIALGAFVLTFGSSLSEAIKNRLKTPEQQAREDEQLDIDREEQQDRADKGAFENTADFLFGEKAGDARRAKAKQAAIDAADAEIEKQAQQAGFANRDELALATDSGALVVGSSKNFIDFGVIGAPEEAISEKPRFGGQAKPKPQPVSDGKTRGQRRFGR